MTSLVLSPSGALLAGALILIFTGGLVRRAVLLAAPLLAFVLVWQIPVGSITANYLDYPLIPIRADALSHLFAAVFALAAFLGALFALDRSSTLELASALV